MSWSRGREEAPGLGAALLVPRGWECSKPGSRGDPTAQPGTLGSLRVVRLSGCAGREQPDSRPASPAEACPGPPKRSSCLLCPP